MAEKPSPVIQAYTDFGPAKRGRAEATAHYSDGSRARVRVPVREVEEEHPLRNEAGEVLVDGKGRTLMTTVRGHAVDHGARAERAKVVEDG